MKAPLHNIVIIIFVTLFSNKILLFFIEKRNHFTKNLHILSEVGFVI